MAGTGEENQLQNKNKNKNKINNNNVVERKVMEKNRRNQMKSLYTKLNSLLPIHHSNNDDDQVPLTVLDQIEEAIKYIKSLQTKLKNEKEKKERLLKRSKTSSSSSDVATATTTTKSQMSSSNYNYDSPQLKIKEMGSAVEVVLTSGLEDPFLFYDIIHIFHEERAEIINASYSVIGNTVFYSIHAEIEDVVYEFGATKLTERLNTLVYKWKNDEEILQGAAASSSSHPAANTPTTSSHSDCHFKPIG